jgi:hypothetical protein
MDKAIRRFWWKGDNASKKYMAWKNWKDLCSPKAEGAWGLGNLKYLIRLYWPS